MTIQTTKHRCAARILLFACLALVMLPTNLSAAEIKNRWQNTYLGATPSGLVETGAPLASAASQWIIEPVGGPEGYVRLRSVSTGKLVHIENGTLELGVGEAGWWSAQWIIEQAGDYVRLRNRWKPTIYIHNENGRLEAGEIDPGWWSAQWTVDGQGMSNTAQADSAPTSTAAVSAGTSSRIAAPSVSPTAAKRGPNTNTSQRPVRTQPVGTNTTPTVNVVNTTSAPVRVFSVGAGNNLEELGTVQAGQSLTVSVSAKTTLQFAQGEGWLGDPFQATAASRQSVRLPYSAPASTSSTASGATRKAGINDVDIDAIADEVVDQIVQQMIDQQLHPPACWRDTDPRGVGTIPNRCPAGDENDGVMCYDKCKPGYRGKATMCLPTCPSNFTDTGLHCLKPAAYKRDEYPWEFGDTLGSLDDARARCRKDHGSNCVTANSSTIVYETCKTGYKTAPMITNLCSPICPSNTTDIGVSCQMNTYDRGVGRLRDCGPGEERDAGLCYKKCKPGQKGIGPVCWDQCPANLPVNCGAACAKTDSDCASAVTDQVSSPLIAAGSIALTVATAGTATGATAAAKTGAAAGKAAAKAAAKSAARATAKAALKGQVKKLIKSQAGQFAKNAVKDVTLDAAIGSVITTSVWASMDAYAQGELKKTIKTDVAKAPAEKLDDEAVEAIVELVMKGVEEKNPGSDFPWESLDPTGIAEIVVAYNLPICSDVK